MNHEKSAVQRLLQDYAHALNASDTGAVMRLYAPDGVFMPQHSPSSIERPPSARPTTPFLRRSAST